MPSIRIPIVIHFLNFLTFKRQRYFHCYCLIQLWSIWLIHFQVVEPKQAFFSALLNSQVDISRWEESVHILREREREWQLEKQTDLKREREIEREWRIPKSRGEHKGFFQVTSEILFKHVKFTPSPLSFWAEKFLDLSKIVFKCIKHISIGFQNTSSWNNLHHCFLTF